MNAIIGVLITFLVVILVLYLVNMLPMDGRAKQIVRVRRGFVAQISGRVLRLPGPRTPVARYRGARRLRACRSM